MAGTTNKFQMGRRNFDEIVRFPDGPASFADMVFGFLEDGEESSESSCNSGEWEDVGDSADDDAEDGNSCNVEENKAFWEGQDELLQATLCRSSTLESKIRQATREALKELTSTDTCCVCRRPVASGCRSCLRKEISDRLRNAGYNCVICKSKWRNSPDIPSGEHTYLEVVEKSSSRRSGEVRVVIELNFRGEFEMARASEEYNRLISRLPEVFVGKAERLRALIKILCTAAKKCMKEKKMHMGPWRKYKYMEAKWLGTCERMTQAQAPLVPPGLLNRPVKPRASMLSFDLVEKLPSLHCGTAVAVV